MLEQMRNLSSVFSKTLLGVIALSFILFYGYSTIDNSNQVGGALIAKVNGENIPAAKFFQGVENQTEMIQQFNQGNPVGPDMRQMIESQVLQRLIQNSLMAQAAHKMGLRVPDQELGQEIRLNPTFQKDGRFNRDFYLNQFLPFYEKTFGSNFEYDFRQDLLAEKLRKVVENSAVVAQAEVESQLKVQNTLLKLRQLSLPVQGPGALPTAEARKLALDWIAARKENKPVEALLAPRSLKETETEAQNLVQLQAGFGREDSLVILQCLLALKPGEVCEQPIQVGSNLLAFQLLERSDRPVDATARQTAAQQLEMGQKSQLMGGFLDQLTRKAKIQTYLTKR
ncbi:MAG TPA: SurA N-terminal domain-containing protein [bacterium]|nr:SurA N-terminal domain-containing protein [bacterium]